MDLVLASRFEDVEDKENVPVSEFSESIADNLFRTFKDDRKLESNGLDGKEEQVVDAPLRLTQQADAQAALVDLNKISMSIAEKVNSGSDEADSGARGTLYVRQRLLKKSWKKRYASIVVHQYFGPVLFLFKYDKRDQVLAKSAQMIVLEDSQVRLGNNSRDSSGIYRCEFILQTSRKSYIFSSYDSINRDFWISALHCLSEF